METSSVKSNNRENFTADLSATQTRVKSFLARLSLQVRGRQLQYMMEMFKPIATTRILDVGFANDTGIDLADTNYFEKYYAYPESITAASVEDCENIRSRYDPVKIVKIEPDKPLPFKSKEFEIATAWATLEHVGNFDQQRVFLNELLRVGRSIFLTVPYRGCIYEPHTGFFFVHWLPLKWFRFVCKIAGKKVWASESVLNPLYIRDVRRILPEGANIKVYRMFGVLPSHLMISFKEKSK